MELFEDLTQREILQELINIESFTALHVLVVAYW